MSNRMRKITRVGVVLLIVSVIGNLVMFMMGRSPFNIEETTVQRSIPVDQVKELHVLAKLGAVKVIPINGTEIVATLEGKMTKKWVKDYQLAVNDEQGRVFIEIVQKSKVHILDLYSDFQLIIGVPNGVQLDQLRIDTDAENISVKAVHANKYDLTSDTGSIDMEVSDGRLNVKSDTGRITIALEQISADIHAETDSGDISIQTAQAPDAIRTQLQADPEKIHVRLPQIQQGAKNESGPLLKLTTDTGNLTIEHK